MSQEDSIGNADPSKVADPAHPSSGNDDHTTTSGSKPTGVVEAVLDPDFLPSTTKAPFMRKIQSYGVILMLVIGAMLGARLFMHTEILQTEMPVFVATGAAVAATIMAVTGDIDWWDLMLTYWWLSVPGAAVGGILLVFMGENATGLTHVE